MAVPAIPQSSYYVRLAPTTLYRAPDCYLSRNPDLSGKKCGMCPVRRQCEQGMPAEVKQAEY